MIPHAKSRIGIQIKVPQSAPGITLSHQSLASKIANPKMLPIIVNAIKVPQGAPPVEAISTNTTTNEKTLITGSMVFPLMVFSSGAGIEPH